MTSRQVLTLILVLFSLGGGIPLAQGGSDTDPRFEKLAKDLYPKAKQEGALVVYTIWDVEHIRSILDVFNKRFPGINTTYWQGTRSEIITRTLTEIHPRLEGAQRDGSQEHERHVSPVDRRGIFDRHTVAVARCHRRKGKGKSGGFRQERRSGDIGATIGYLRQGAAYQWRQAFCRVDDYPGRPAGGVGSGSGSVAQRRQV